MDLLIATGYVGVWMLSGAAIARGAAADFRTSVGVPESLLGALAGLMWPLFVFPAGIYWLATRETPSERRDRLVVERDSRVAEQARTIARLEREAGIR